jgi:4-diphosphocytidyl-2-C-methyl-D-erythritol kinase
MISAMRVRAFAKINLSLRVLGTRLDGYHRVRTVFQSIALHDTLTIRAARGPLHLTCDDPSCPDDDANLIGRAADRVWHAAQRRGAPRDVAVALKKRIPIEAGLAGGSSDAAAALRAFGRLWRVDRARLRAIGRELGADVPYFFEGGTVLGLERGDRLFPLIDYPAAWVVLVLPGFGVSTREAFGWFDSDSGRRARGVRPKGAGGRARAPDGPALGPADLVNDLEPPVAARHPEISRSVGALRKAGASHAAMTGSGSTVFGLFARRTQAAAAARLLSSRARRAFVTRTLNRSQYQRLAGM